VVLFLSPEFRRQTVDVTVELAPVPIEIVSDRIQMQQVVVNLAMNAVQAMAINASGSRRLVIRTRSEATAAVLEVADTGPGIAAGQFDMVFKTFFTTKSSGTGIGLAICRSIVESYGGRILVANNTTGNGAVFSVEFPFPST
jgi:signal transduction histidine kinase